MLSDMEYAAKRAAIDMYNEWAKQFTKPNGWTVIPGDAVPPVEVTNADRSAVEVFEFMRDKPDSYFAYIGRIDRTNNPTLAYDAVLTTWTGDKLGTVKFGREWRDSFGGRRIPITVRAITGDTYHGTYFTSSGDYARIRKAKTKTRYVTGDGYTFATLDAAKDHAAQVFQRNGNIVSIEHR